MARVRENGCASMECVNCDRSHQYYTYYECDSCGEGAHFRYDGNDYCESCLLVALRDDEIIENIPEEDDD